VRVLFGTLAQDGADSAGRTAIFGFACLLVAAAGVLVSLWRWPRLRRAEQLLLVATFINIAVYTVSTLPAPQSSYDIVAVLPASAILAARSLVPDRITGRVTATVAILAAVIAALLPMSLAAAARPPQVAPLGLTAWLEAHGLRYGLGGYWDGSVVTLESGGQVAVRTVRVVDGKVRPFPWETNTFWFDPARHYANFVVFGTADLPRSAERYFGKPVSSHRVGIWEVLIYNKNLLPLVAPPVPPPTS
jgi:hypothetical protein